MNAQPIPAEPVAGLTITLAGSIMGMPFDSMMAGFVGALIAQTFVPSGVGKVRAFAQLAAAGLLAGMLAPLAESVVFALAPATWRLSLTAVHLAAGAIIGMIAPAVVPLVRKIADRFGDKL